MKMAKRKNKKKQQEEELLIDLAEKQEQAKEYYQRNQMLILGALFGFVFLFGGWYVYKNLIKAPQEKEASAQLYGAENQFLKDSFALALTNPGGEYPGLLEVIDEYSGTNAGNLANYYAGVCYLNLGQYAKAIEYLEDFSPAGSVTPSTTLGLLGDAHSELNDMDKALSYYKQASDKATNEVVTPYYLLKAGMLMEKQGKKDDAISMYEKIKSEYPKSIQGTTIDKYIARVSNR